MMEKLINEICEIELTIYATKDERAKNALADLLDTKSHILSVHLMVNYCCQIENSTFLNICMIRIMGKFDREKFNGIVLNVLLQGWHNSHEAIVDLWGRIPTFISLVIEHFDEIVSMDLAYLTDYDGWEPYVRKLFYLMRKSIDPRSKEIILRYSKSTDPVLRQLAMEHVAFTP